MNEEAVGHGAKEEKRAVENTNLPVEIKKECLIILIDINNSFAK